MPGAEGSICLEKRRMEKLWSALERVDSSSGVLGTAVNKALDALIPVIVSVPADDKTRNKWLDRLWQAMVSITSARSVTTGVKSVVQWKSPGDECRRNFEQS